MSEFKTHVQSEFQSLGAFALTINLSLCITIFSTGKLLLGSPSQGSGSRSQLHSALMTSMFPLSQLVYLVFSSAILLIAVYTK